MRCETKEEEKARNATEYALGAIYRMFKFSKIPSDLLPIIENEIVNAYLEGNKKNN